LIIPRLIAEHDGNRRSRTGALVASGNEAISTISSEAVAAAAASC